jgi:glycerol-3-phosphate cytidylyltransferase-like family protein
MQPTSPNAAHDAKAHFRPAAVETKSELQAPMATNKPSTTPTLFERILDEIWTGVASSVMVEAILFPIDTLKHQQQLSSGSVMQIFMRIISEKGVGGLYHGLGGRLIQTVTSNVGFFIWQRVFLLHALAKYGRPIKQGGPPQLGTGMSLALNMLAQQLNRVLTTPIDVVANVNQGDPNSRGFISTFLRLARTGGRAALWRGLPVTLILAMNPALMFTLVAKAKDIVAARTGGPVSPSSIFWITGLAKTVSTFLTYPLIRAKVVTQTRGGDLWPTLLSLSRQEGVTGLYTGIWIMSYKTVFFNSLMMSLKNKLTALDSQRKKLFKRRQSVIATEGPWRRHVRVVQRGGETPWEAAARGASVAYLDGTWSFLHPAQLHILNEAARRFDHLVVGIHHDNCHQKAIGSLPAEVYTVRSLRLLTHTSVTSIVEGAPWAPTLDMISQLGITKVLSGSTRKDKTVLDTPAAPPSSPKPGTPHFRPGTGHDLDEHGTDPYIEVKRLGIYEEVPSLDRSTTEAWFKAASFVLFSPPGAVEDKNWEILAGHTQRGKARATSVPLRGRENTRATPSSATRSHSEK